MKIFPIIVVLIYLITTNTSYTLFWKLIIIIYWIKHISFFIYLFFYTITICIYSCRCILVEFWYRMVIILVQSASPKAHSSDRVRYVSDTELNSSRTCSETKWENFKYFELLLWYESWSVNTIPICFVCKSIIYNFLISPSGKILNPLILQTVINNTYYLHNNKFFGCTQFLNT